MIKLLIIIFAANIFSFKILAKTDQNVKKLDYPIKIGSIKTSNAFLRYGPGKNYPVQWEFIKKHWPLQILEEFDVWKKIRTIDGSEGWMHKTQLSFKKTSLTLNRDYLRKKPLKSAKKLAYLKKNILVKILECKKYWCKIELDENKFRGWFVKNYLWGSKLF